MPERLFERIILRVVVEVPGATNGALILAETGALVVRARVGAAEGVSVSLAAAPLDQCADRPSAILRYVVRLKELLVLSDAAAEGTFAADPAVRRRKLRSVLCVPLTKQAKMVGLLYLENDTMAGAFADELVELVQVLASQAVTSLENSTLWGALQHLTGELEERVADRTRPARQ